MEWKAKSKLGMRLSILQRGQFFSTLTAVGMGQVVIWENISGAQIQFQKSGWHRSSKENILNAVVPLIRPRHL